MVNETAIVIWSEIECIHSCLYIKYSKIVLIWIIFHITHNSVDYPSQIKSGNTKSCTLTKQLDTIGD